MKHGVGLIVGIGFILAAFWIAVGTSNQDTAPRPPVALALATEFHRPPGPTRTPEPTTRAVLPLSPFPPSIPSPMQIMDLVFNTPPQTVYRVILPKNLMIRAVHPYYMGQDELIVTGDHTVFWMEGQALPAAFGAILLWDHGRYAVRFSHLLLGRKDAQVTLSLSPKNADLVFFFKDIGPGGVEGDAIAQAYHVDCFVDECQVLGGR